MVSHISSIKKALGLFLFTSHGKKGWLMLGGGSPNLEVTETLSAAMHYLTETKSHDKHIPLTVWTWTRLIITGDGGLLHSHHWGSLKAF